MTGPPHNDVLASIALVNDMTYEEWIAWSHRDAQLATAYYLAAQWHDKQAAGCEARPETNLASGLTFVHGPPKTPGITGAVRRACGWRPPLYSAPDNPALSFIKFATTTSALSGR